MSAATTSGKESTNGSKPIKGTIRKVKMGADGLTEIHIDNGSDRKITLVCLTEDTYPLAVSAAREIHQHMTTIRRGRFRRKQ